eukprot:gene54321-27492_t
MLLGCLSLLRGLVECDLSGLDATGDARWDWLPVLPAELWAQVLPRLLSSSHLTLRRLNLRRLPLYCNRAADVPLLRECPPLTHLCLKGAAGVDATSFVHACPRLRGAGTFNSRMPVDGGPARDGIRRIRIGHY